VPVASDENLTRLPAPDAGHGHCIAIHESFVDRRIPALSTIGRSEGLSQANWRAVARRAQTANQAV
jgi:hypothetical protein